MSLSKILTHTSGPKKLSHIQRELAQQQVVWVVDFIAKAIVGMSIVTASLSLWMGVFNLLSPYALQFSTGTAEALVLCVCLLLVTRLVAVTIPTQLFTHYNLKPSETEVDSE